MYRVVSKEIKEVFIWMGVVMLIPRSLNILKNFKKSLENIINLESPDLYTPLPDPGGPDVPMDVEIIDEEKIGNSHIDNHFNTLFGSMLLSDG
jgi:hypothetical protein